MSDFYKHNDWEGKTFASALRHNQSCEIYNPDFRQLLHVGYKVAAQMGDAFLGVIQTLESTIVENVMDNILQRHIKKVFYSSDFNTTSKTGGRE